MHLLMILLVFLPKKEFYSNLCFCTFLVVLIFILSLAIV